MVDVHSFFSPGQLLFSVTSSLITTHTNPILTSLLKVQSRSQNPGYEMDEQKQSALLYSWLVHGHMTSNNETVSRQMPWAGNIAKTMTSNGKQFTVTNEMLTAVARDQSVQLEVAWCCHMNLRAFFKMCFCFVLLYNKLLHDWSLGKRWILFPSNLNIFLNFVSGNIELLGKHCFSRDQSLSVNCRRLMDMLYQERGYYFHGGITNLYCRNRRKAKPMLRR